MGEANAFLFICFLCTFGTDSCTMSGRDTLGLICGLLSCRIKPPLDFVKHPWYYKPAVLNWLCFWTRLFIMQCQQKCPEIVLIHIFLVLLCMIFRRINICLGNLVPPDIAKTFYFSPWFLQCNQFMMDKSPINTL